MNDVSTNELLAQSVNNGCSGTFAACVATDIDGRHIAREVAYDAARRDGRPAMGGFTSALWDGDARAAWRRADSQSRRLMEAAGVAPTELLARAGGD